MQQYPPAQTGVMVSMGGGGHMAPQTHMTSGHHHNMNSGHQAHMQGGGHHQNHHQSHPQSHMSPQNHINSMSSPGAGGHMSGGHHVSHHHNHHHDNYHHHPHHHTSVPP